MKETAQQGVTHQALQPAHWVVIDTNTVLDMWVFADPAVQALKAALTTKNVQWWALPRMRDELQRVLNYPHIAKRLQLAGRTATEVLQHFDQHAHTHAHTAVAKAPYTCKDADDQIFIDLACALAQGGVRQADADAGEVNSLEAASDMNPTVSRPRPRVDLVSKDLHVLRMRSRLARLGVGVVKVWAA